MRRSILAFEDALRERHGFAQYRFGRRLAHGHHVIAAFYSPATSFGVVICQQPWIYLEGDGALFPGREFDAAEREQARFDTAVDRLQIELWYVRVGQLAGVSNGHRHGLSASQPQIRLRETGNLFMTICLTKIDCKLKFSG